MRRRAVITIAIASVAVGCGLVSGLDHLHVGDADASSSDGSSSDAGSDVILVECDGGCGFSLPSGFTLVTYATALPVTCPDGTTPESVVADPSVPQDACSCRCSMKTKATCSAAVVNLLVNDGGTTCPNLLTALSGTPGCHTTTVTLSSSGRADTSASGKMLLDAGACQTSEVPDASALTSTPAQVCLPSSCEATQAMCTPPAGQRLCAVSNGDVACPAPFTEKHSVGASATVACSTCASTCTINPPNCDFSDSFTLYTDTACSAGSNSISNCTLIGVGGTYKSYEYKITASGGCTTTATSSASASLAAQQTVCCQPGN